MNELAALGILVLAMSGIYAFMLRGTKESLTRRKGDKKGASLRILETVGGNRKESELVTGLLATFALATLTLHAGAAESMVAGGLMGVLAAVCVAMPLVRVPVHFLYSILGIFGALDAARRYLFLPGLEPGEYWLRWALLILVWTFAVFGVLAGFARGYIEWKLGLLMYAWAEILIFAAELLGASQLTSGWLIIVVLLSAVVLGYVASTRWEPFVEFAAALGMTLGTIAIFGVDFGVPGTRGFLQATGSTMALIMVFLVVFAVLRAGLRRSAKLLPF